MADIKGLHFFFGIINKKKVKLNISPREKEVLLLLAFEYTSKEIAQKLFISQHTAFANRKNLLIKMSARNPAGLVRKAFENKILNIS